MRSLIVVLAMAVVCYSSKSYSGELECLEADDGGCRISWDLSDTPRSEITLERFDSKSGKWIVEETDNNSYGTSDLVAKPGSLYKVKGCNVGVEDECVSSNAYWVPVVPQSIEDIPAFVYKKNGDPLSISKSVERLSTQTIQYNVYLFVRDFEGVDLGHFPAMTEPTELNNLFDIVSYNIFPNYMGYRDTALGNPPDMTPEYPDARVSLLIWTRPVLQGSSYMDPSRFTRQF